MCVTKVSSYFWESGLVKDFRKPSAHLMHEIGVVDNILCAINSKLKESRQHSKVKRVNILIGELEHITPGHFEFHFRQRTKGTSLENAELNFRRVDVRFRCKSCSREFSGGGGTLGCPECRSNASDIIAGSGIFVESIEM